MSERSRNPVRRALRALTHGVYVLGVAHDNRDDYFVVSLVSQCSVEPPRIALSLTHGARVLPALRAEQGGVLAILDAESASAVRRYGTPGGVRNVPENPMRSTSTQHPVCPEAAMWLAFRVHSELSVGDHVLVIADVVEAGGPLAEADADNTFTPMTLRDSRFPYAG